VFGIVFRKGSSCGDQCGQPLASVIRFSIQTKEHKETMEVLSREGLTIGLEISALYRLDPDSAARVYKTVAGGDYETIILIPQFRSISRAVTASFQASALYSTERGTAGRRNSGRTCKNGFPAGSDHRSNTSAECRSSDTTDGGESNRNSGPTRKSADGVHPDKRKAGGG